MKMTTVSVPEEVRRFIKKKAAEYDCSQIDIIERALRERYDYG